MINAFVTCGVLIINMKQQITDTAVLIILTLARLSNGIYRIQNNTKTNAAKLRRVRYLYIVSIICL